MENREEFRTGVIQPIECVKEAWERIKNDYWLLLGITLVGAVIGGFSMYILLGAMACGMFYCYLQAIDGKPVAFDGLWKGFSRIGPGLVVTAFIVVPIIVVYAVMYVPFIVMIASGAKLSDEEFVSMLIGVGIVDFVLIVVMTCFHTLLMFAFPLVIDRNLSGMAAIKTSVRAAWRNLSGVAGLIGVNIGLAFLGYLALCIGIYFVIPVILATNAVAYRKVFPSGARGEFSTPPPPQAYQNL